MTIEHELLEFIKNIYMLKAKVMWISNDRYEAVSTIGFAIGFSTPS
jgi:hypothetical protein